MLRFILRRKVVDRISGMENVTYRTLDIDVPELESRLNNGGYGENGCDITSLLGVEIMTNLIPGCVEREVDSIA